MEERVNDKKAKIDEQYQITHIKLNTYYLHEGWQDQSVLHLRNEDYFWMFSLRYGKKTLDETVSRDQVVIQTK